MIQWFRQYRTVSMKRSKLTVCTFSMEDLLASMIQLQRQKHPHQQQKQQQIQQIFGIIAAVKNYFKFIFGKCGY